MQKAQRGSIITFVVVGFILAAALVGSVYLVKQRGTVVVDAPGTPVVTTPEKGETTTPQPAVSREPALPGNTPPSSGQSPVSQSGPLSATSVAATGPVENSLVLAAVLGVVVYMTVAYKRSRISSL